MEAVMGYIVRKQHRTGGAYTGPACALAGVQPGAVYETPLEAELAHAALSRAGGPMFEIKTTAEVAAECQTPRR